MDLGVYFSRERMFPVVVELLPYPGLDAHLLLTVPTKGSGCSSPNHSLSPSVMVLWQEPELRSMLEPSPEAYSF